MPKVSKKAKASKSAAPTAAPASVKAAKSKTSNCTLTMNEKKKLTESNC